MLSSDSRSEGAAKGNGGLSRGKERETRDGRSGPWTLGAAQGDTSNAYTQGIPLGL